MKDRLCLKTGMINDRGYKRPRCSLPFGHKGKHRFEWRPGV